MSTSQVNVLLTDRESRIRPKKGVKVNKKVTRRLEESSRVLVLTTASGLSDHVEFIRRANSKHRLKALLVRSDVQAEWVATQLDAANIRTLRNLLVHSGHDVPERVIFAWSVGAEDDLIATATTTDDSLLVRDCAMRFFTVRFEELPKLRELPAAQRSRFQIDKNGSFLYWPKPDIYIDLDTIRSATDEAWREKARYRRAAFDRLFGRAVAELRQRAGLRQSDYRGISRRQIGRIERGQVVARFNTIEKLAATQGLSVAVYLEEVAEAIPRLRQESASGPHGESGSSARRSATDPSRARRGELVSEPAGRSMSVQERDSADRTMVKPPGPPENLKPVEERLHDFASELKADHPSGPPTWFDMENTASAKLDQTWGAAYRASRDLLGIAWKSCHPKQGPSPSPEGFDNWVAIAMGTIFCSACTRFRATTLLLERGLVAPANAELRGLFECYLTLEFILRKRVRRRRGNKLLPLPKGGLGRKVRARMYFACYHSQMLKQIRAGKKTPGLKRLMAKTRHGTDPEQQFQDYIDDLKIADPHLIRDVGKYNTAAGLSIFDLVVSLGLKEMYVTVFQELSRETHPNNPLAMFQVQDGKIVLTPFDMQRHSIRFSLATSASLMLAVMSSHYLHAGFDILPDIEAANERLEIIRSVPAQVSSGE